MICGRCGESLGYDGYVGTIDWYTCSNCRTRLAEFDPEHNNKIFNSFKVKRKQWFAS